MSKLSDWIDKIAQENRTLAALLRGLVTVIKGEDVLTFVWHSEFHRGEGVRRDAEIRRYLGQLSKIMIVQVTLAEQAEEDPMLAEALALGARVKEA